MGKALGKRCVWSLCGVVAALLMMVAVTEAEVSTDLSGSILVWPKVISNEVRDTVIQISNTGNQVIHVHCFYVNAAPRRSDIPPDPVLNPRQWQETDFFLWLTRQQPFHWVASQGRFVDPFDGFGQDGSGLDAGAVPPVAPGFEGELKCVQIDASGIPFGGNSLKGEAVIRRADGDVSKYNAISILAFSDLAPAPPERELLLDNTEGNDGEFNSCPNTLLLNHYTDGAPDPAVFSSSPAQCGVFNGGTLADAGRCPVRTELTLVPCSQDLENQRFSRSTVQFSIFNEFEQEFSASTTVECWLNVSLGDITAAQGRCSEGGETCRTDADCIDIGSGFCTKQGIFSYSVLGTVTAYTRIQPVGLDPGVIGVVEELHLNAAALDSPPGTRGAWAAFQLHQEGSRFEATIDVEDRGNFGPVIDRIIIPEI
jgi:hypothetical protein